MIENVFILGAGASKESGAPLMNDFLDRAEDLLRGEVFGDDSIVIEKVFEIISELQKVYSKSYLDTSNIETLFGALEMAKIINQLGSYSKEEIISYRDSLIKLIVRTIEHTMNFRNYNTGVQSTESYEEFINLIKAKGIGTSSIISFNYDMGVDVAIYSSGSKINYCLHPNEINGIRLLKLHGSINWYRCKNNGDLDYNKIIPYTMDSFSSDFHFRNYGNIKIPFSKYINIIRDRNLDLEFDSNPVIVPPTWNKSEYQGSLTNVWSAAANDLGKARNIYIFGYSLPETDSFFRYLYALGTIGDTRIRRFWVFDPDNSGFLEQRYRALLGAGIKNRFEFINHTFSDGLKELRKRIRV